MAPSARVVLSEEGWANLDRVLSESELREATERATDDEGLVDPFALAEALAVPMHGAIRSGDPHARFAGDAQTARLAPGDA